ncbi:MAG: DUF3782 domain-containing protein [Deltaproteobacteria bacterium]|nr:DUF3782 domain-containing protein [Deltaproteobacteria bacterium]
MSQEEIKAIIISELPKIVEKDPDIRRYVLDITRGKYANKEKTGDRIDRILGELKQDREENSRKWAAQEKKWEEHRKEDAAKWAAQEKKWEENQRVIEKMVASVEALSKKHDSTIGALGARWGLYSESAFRNGLKGILEDSFGVKVERYQDVDPDGKVFGRPDQVEMDVIIHNGTLILCEIKSSVSWEEMYVFWRKKEFYEDKHGRKANRVMVISPMVDERAKKVAQELGIEVFGYAEDVDLPKP